MSARKLQQEMDRVFKRVAEGVVAFDNIYDKLHMATAHSQKEKLEQDLKREVKKLQKLRDQIKTWISSNEVRDKKQLIEQRKLIETEMERFRVVEREVKTKTYSKEGEDEPLDPHEKEKREAVDFFDTVTQQIEEQTEALETELESLQGTKRGKKDTAKQERMSEIDTILERNKWHINKIEIIVRMLENDTLAPEAAMSLEDDINYYVESNQEVDFAEDDAMYDDLNLVEDEEDEEILETIVRDDTYTLEDLAQDLSKEAAEKAAGKKGSGDESKEGSSSGEKETPTKDVAKDPAAKEDKRPTPPPIPQGLNPLPAVNKKKDLKRDSPGPQAGPAGSSASPLQTASSIPSGPSAGVSSGPSSGPSGPSITGLAQSSPARSESPSAASSAAPSAAMSRAGSPALASSTAAVPAAASTATIVPSLPPGLQDLASAFDAAKQRVLEPPAWSSISKLVDASYRHCPDSEMADQPRYYHPESPYPTPDYYPTEMLSTLDDAALFAKMDVDTLFYIFYYRQGSHQQYLAAKELKGRSWRFHKRFLTWFQRHEEPKSINADFEQGTYRFFDFEGSWLQRRKSNFKFEYKFLEDEIV